MRNAKNIVTGLLAVALLPASFPSSAQAPDVFSCQSIEDRLERYACYDRVDSAGTTSPQRAAPAARATRQEEAEQEEGGFLGRLFDRDEDQPEEPTQTVSEDSSVPAANSVDGFGRSQASNNARVREGLDGKDELIDTIARLEQHGPSMWLITLESGQQWRQMLSKSYRLREGDEVRIYPTIWGGSYRLTAERLAGYIQVERVN